MAQARLHLVVLAALAASPAFAADPPKLCPSLPSPTIAEITKIDGLRAKIRSLTGQVRVLVDQVAELTKERDDAEAALQAAQKPPAPTASH